MIYKRLADQQAIRDSPTSAPSIAYMAKIKFLNRFFLFSGLSKIKHEYKASKGESLEEVIVKNFSCNPKWPVCLYDFTYKIICEQYFLY
jgi:hypothetical protein